MMMVPHGPLPEDVKAGRDAEEGYREDRATRLAATIDAAIGANHETGELPDFTHKGRSEPQGYETLLDEQLLAFWKRVDAAEREQREMKLRVEWEIQRRMEERGARELPHPDLICALVPGKTEYDNSRLAKLREMLPPEVTALGFTPEHAETKTLPDKWDGRVVAGWGRKYGDDVAEVIEQAKVPSQRAKLRIAAK